MRKQPAYIMPATPDEIERLVWYMPSVAERATTEFARGFAQSVVKQSRRRNWQPSKKQLPIMRDLVRSLFVRDGYVGGDFDVIE